ncbi:MAG: crotonase/enoyl-CoA hydratase family protein [Pseudomonadota bacterium]
MSDTVHYSFADGIARIRIDDGKRNALSPAVLADINAALDHAEADRAVVILTGRDDVFSAGFDLNVMKRGGPTALKMLKTGYAMTARVLAHPRPVIVACNGHCMAMGVFLMLAADYVIGTRGDYKVAANEVAIGLPMPRTAATMLRHRLSPSAYQRAVTLGEAFDVDAALEAGFFDTLVAADELVAQSTAKAVELKNIDAWAHANAKRQIRRSVIRRIRWTVWADMLQALRMAIRGTKPRQQA